MDRMLLVERVVRKEYLFRDRLNPFTYYDDEEFTVRYRLRKDSVISLLDQLGGALEPKQERKCNVPAYMQLLVGLRFFATGSFLRADGDLFGIHECTVSRIIKRVSGTIASLKGMYINFPTGNRARQIQESFMQMCNIPGIVGAIDCTHIAIQEDAVGGDLLAADVSDDAEDDT